MDEIEALSLRDGTTLRAVAVGSELVALSEGPRGTARVALPYPREGVGGGRWYASPSERLAVLSLYSGQSAEGYEVFAISPTLQHLCGLPYVHGELASFAFSASEASLVMAYSLSCTEFTQEELADGVVDGDAVVFPVGALIVRALASTRLSRCEIRVRIERDRELGSINGEALNPRFVDESQLAFSLPWREDVRVALPLPEHIVVPLRRAAP